MTPGFFSISDQNLKLRRNLLFAATLYMIHMTMVPLENLKVFNVEINKSFLDMGLPLSILWFTFNYASTLITEYVQWQSSHIDPENPKSTGHWKGKTFIPSLIKATNKELTLKTDFISGKNIEGASLYPEETALQNITDIMKNKLSDIEEQFKVEIKRIEQFEKAINNYHTLSQAKFWALDVVIPSLALTFSTILYLR